VDNEAKQAGGFGLGLIRGFEDDDEEQLLPHLQDAVHLGVKEFYFYGSPFKNMYVSIIVPTLNEEAYIVETIRSLQRLSGEREIIVVDGGSTDQTVALASARKVRVVEAPQGRGLQMHIGALESRGDVLWFVHADTVPPPPALEHIRKSLETKSTVGGNFGLLFDGPSRAARQLTAIYPLLRIFGLCYGDSGIFVRRDAYHQIGGFRSLLIFEDLDLIRRLRRVGRFIHLNCRIVTSSRRFEHRNFALMWLRWTTLQLLYWCGVSPSWLSRWYPHARGTSA
jgi:rSAM/selenodomain-associated transferase 2